jgi:O-antigen ligase
VARTARRRDHRIDVVPSDAAPPASSLGRRARLPALLLPLLFVVAHAQDVQPMLAPLALAPLALMSVVHPPRGTDPARLVVAAALAFFVVVAVINGTLAGAGGADFVRRYGAGLYSLVVFYVFLRLTSRDRELVPRVLRTGLLVAGVLAGVYLFAQFVRPLSLLGTDLARDGRMLGLLGAHNPTAAQLGAFALVGLVGLLALPGHLGAGSRPATWAWWATGLCVVGMLAARSRGYTLGLVVAVVYVLWTRRRSIPRTWSLPLHGMAAVGLVVAGALLLGSRFGSPLADDPNVITRFALWERAADLVARSPLTGLGVGAFQQQHLDTATVIPGAVAVRTGGDYLPQPIPLDAEGGLHSHNLYLQMLSEVGLVGTVLYFWPLVRAWRRAGPRQGAIGATFRTLFVYLGVAGLTAGLTMTSPTASWPLFAAAAHVLTERSSVKAPSAASA